MAGSRSCLATGSKVTGAPMLLRRPRSLADSDGSMPTMTSVVTLTGSRRAPGGHLAHRGFPSRLPQLSACGIWPPDGAADCAVTVLATLLDGAQELAALGAGRRGDTRRSDRAQGDEAVKEHLGPVLQRLSQSAALGPYSGHLLRHLPYDRLVQRGITPGDQDRDDPARVFRRLRADHQHHRPPGEGDFALGIRRPAATPGRGSRRAREHTGGPPPMPP